MFIWRRKTLFGCVKWLNVIYDFAFRDCMQLPLSARFHCRKQVPQFFLRAIKIKISYGRTVLRKIQIQLSTPHLSIRNPHQSESIRIGNYFIPHQRVAGLISEIAYGRTLITQQKNNDNAILKTPLNYKNIFKIKGKR